MDIAVQPDGKILAVANETITDEDWSHLDGVRIVRYNEDGSLDNSFDDDGILSLDFDNREVIFDILLQPDGNILLGGKSYIPNNDYNIMLVRLNSDGSYDNTFRSSGVSFYDLDYDIIYYFNSTLQPDGNLVVTGAIGTDDERSNIFTARILTGLEASEAPLLITTDPALNDLLIYPNPASLTASIEYTLTSSQSISINLYNLQGGLIKTVSNEFQFAGNYTKAPLHQKPPISM
jgi:uncharacterized delta-60 repeat protein